MLTSYWFMFSLLSVLSPFASSTSNSVPYVGSNQLKFWKENVVNDMPQALVSKLSPMNKIDSEYYTSLVSKGSFSFDAQSCLVADIFCTSDTNALGALLARSVKIYKIYASKIPDQAKVYASKIPDQAKVYASKVPNQAKVYPSKIPDQAKVYAFRIPDQAKVYPSKIPDQAKVYPSKIPNQAKVYLSKIPDQAKVYASKIPNQAKVYPSRIPDQAKVYASRIPDQANVYLTKIPDQAKVYATRITDQAKVYPSRIPDQAKVYATRIPDQAKVYATRIPDQAKVYATSHSNHDHLGEVSFFRVSNLKPGNTIPLDNLENPFPHRSFLPSQIASNISINSNHLQHLFPQTFSSPLTKDTTQTTILSCNAPTLKGEVKKCAKSLEEMIEFSKTILKKNHLIALTTNSKEGSGGELRIEKLHKINSQKSVSCHEIFLPFATYFCHLLSSTNIYVVDLVDLNTNAHVNRALAVCHKNTSSLPADHPAFRMLNILPGKGEACHWMSQADLVWVGDDVHA
ncbi:BURP domain-containing protein 17-like [Lycium ferocissimum]|uniref:BURP domain-containing protein 17-like n=1 Tax=Lycium ferocissimum TaxID=112874 RepID=UPI0028152733|nr:BURP domain-containing protein 17-like [Lycium ferocissimum]